MGLIFNIPQKQLDTSNTEQALRQLWKYIAGLQEQLEYTLMNLDSNNIIEISTDKTKIKNSVGETVLNGEMINLKSGKNSFIAGYDSAARKFQFELTDKEGNKVLYLSNGELVISRHVEITVDGGAW